MAETPEDLLPDATRRLIRTTDALDDAAYAEPERPARAGRGRTCWPTSP